MSSTLWQALLAADAAAASAAAAAGCSPRALKACVGTALALVAVHHLLTSRRGAAEAAPVGVPDDGPALAAPQATRAAPPAAAAAARPPARVCVATPGVIFAGPADALVEGQALAPAEDAARAVAALAAVTDVYLITQVAPGDGAARAEAAARESLLAAGVLGSGAGAVPPHRALFCTTQVGRIALVRQVRTLRRRRRSLAPDNPCRLLPTRRGCTWTAARRRCASLPASARGWCTSQKRATAAGRFRGRKLLRRCEAGSPHFQAYPCDGKRMAHDTAACPMPFSLRSSTVAVSVVRPPRQRLQIARLTCLRCS